MEIILGDYKLGRCEEGWAVRKKHVTQKGKNKGDVHWLNPRYYPTLEITLKNTLDRMLRESDEEYVNDVENVIDKIDEVKEELKDFINQLSSALKPQ